VPAVKERTLWEEVLSEIESRLGPKSGPGLIESYLRGASLVDADRDEVVIAAPNEFLKQRIEVKFAAAIGEAVGSLLGARPRVRIIVDPTLEPAKPEKRTTEPDAKSASEVKAKPDPASENKTKTDPRRASPAPRSSGVVTIHHPERRARQSGRLSTVDLAGAAGGSGALIRDPSGVVARFGADLSLENFIVGAGNKLAMRAAERVCDQPGGDASPLVITGADGLGKTHLLAGIARRMCERRPKAKVLFVTAEEFLNQFLAGLKSQATEAFRQRYRKADVVIIDDVHLLRGKEKTQEELSHTLEELKHTGKQVVVACEVSPKRVEGLIERVVQRLISGFVVEIEPPDAETRKRLVEHHARRLKATLTHDVVDFLARGISGNCRDIVGAVQRLQAHAAIGEKIDVPRARKLLHDLVGKRAVAPVEEVILAATAEAFHVTPEELKTGRRQTIARARQVAMFLMRRLTKLSLADIGRFYDKQPSTVTFAESAIRQAIVADDDLNRIVERCVRSIEERR